MAAINLTAAAIERLKYKPSGPSRQVLWDAKVRGLGVRVTPANGRQYVLHYRFHGRSRLISLGRVEDFKNVSQAREKALETLRGARHEKRDPLVERQREAAAGTVGQMLDRWLAFIAKRRSVRTHRDYKYFVDERLKPEFGRHRPTDVTRPDVRRFHARMTEQRGPVHANRVIQALRSAYGWIGRQDDATLPSGFANPVQGIEFNREKTRDEFLRSDELSAVAREIDAESNPWVRGYIWLVLLTAARGIELIRLKWTDVDLERGELVLRDTKNKTDFRQHLSEAAVEVLRNIPKAGSPYVFPPQRSDGEAGHMSRPRDAWYSILERAGVSRRVWLHDLRRTAGVLLGSRRFTAEQIARQLNHKSNVTAKVYVRIADELQQDMADALAGATRA